MPRGTKRVIDFNEQLKKIDDQISLLQSQREEFLQQKRRADLEALSLFLRQNNLPATDAIEYLTTVVAASTTPQGEEV